MAESGAPLVRAEAPLVQADELEREYRTGPEVVHFHFGGNYGWKNRAFTECPVVPMTTGIRPFVHAAHKASIASA